MEIIKTYKKLGETPLDALDRLRKEKSEYIDARLTYAGRLDPMAEGVLLVLSGDYTEEDKMKILELPKTYYFEVLWGFETDSFDILGKPKRMAPLNFDKENIIRLISEIKKIKVMSYPPYSSKTISGKPLFELAKEEKLNEDQIPKREVNIYSLEQLNTFEITGQNLLNEILKKILLVRGEFRQKDIIEDWMRVLEDNLENKFLISSFRAKVSSGTYIRAISKIMGQKMSSGALTYKIIRESVGEYDI